MELKPTTKVGEALALAQREAQGSGNPDITPAHLALVLAQQPDTTTPALLTAGGTSAEAVAAAARHTLGSLPRTSGSSVQTPGLGQQALAVPYDLEGGRLPEHARPPRDRGRDRPGA